MPDGGSGPRRLPADKPNFDAFYGASYRRLVVQVHAYLGDRAEAEDVVQEAFIRAWDRWSKVSGLDDPAGWVRRVAWNLATSRLRRLATMRRSLSRDRPPDNAPPPSPDHVALVGALRQLPDRQRRAVVLHYIADLPVTAIAAELDVPKGTVLSWLHRGRAQLALELDVSPLSTAQLPSHIGGDRHA